MRSLVLASLAIAFILPLPAQASGVSYTTQVSNVYYGEETEYSASFTLPKGTEVGWITIGMSTGDQDLANARLVVTGLPAGENVIQRQKRYSASDTIQYILSPSVTLEQDTAVSLTLTGVVNQPFQERNFETTVDPAPIVGFGHISVRKQSENTTESVSMQTPADIFSNRLTKRVETRATPFETKVNFETDNRYFGETANHTFSFSLPKGMYVGQITFGYSEQNVDLSHATLEVTGLPAGTAKINGPATSYHYFENFSYTLPKTTLLTEDTRISFKILNAKNPEYSMTDSNTIGISSQMYISESLTGANGSTSLFDYNLYYTPIRFYGTWQSNLWVRQQNEAIVEVPVQQTKESENSEVKEIKKEAKILSSAEEKAEKNTAKETKIVKRTNSIYKERMQKMKAVEKSNVNSSTTLPTAKKEVREHFTRALKLGSRGADVKQLQKYLNENGFIITSTGAGSPGNENEYFGSMTKKALMAFQKSKKISPASGVFGPVTIKIVNSEES